MRAEEIKRILPNASRSFLELNTVLDKDNLCAITVMALDANLLYNSYLRTKSVHRTALEFNTSGETVRRIMKRAGYKLFGEKWSEKEIEVLRQCYASSSGGIDRKAISSKLRRSEGAVACKASELGITIGRGHQIKTEAHRKALGIAQKKRWETNPGFDLAGYMAGKPNGFAGKTHTPEMCDEISRRSVALWKKRPHPRGMKGKRHTVAARMAISKGLSGKKVPPERVMRQMQTRASKYGSLCPNKKRGSWKAGWRIIAGRKIYARSRWEANYARYLQFLKVNGEIKEWEHEPMTFWFNAIKRGVRSYLPDFRVTLNDGSIEFHEVKGWNDARSQTKAKRMKKYYPNITVILRDSKWFKENSIKLSGFIPEWER